MIDSQGSAHTETTTSASRQRLLLVLGFTLSYMFVEAAGGFLTGSLALVADAAHMLTDVGALGLALLANWLATLPPTPERTFGFYRTEVLAAFANGVVLVALTLYLFWEAGRRLRDPPTVSSVPMLLVAVVGLGVNLAGMYILAGGREESLNVQGAFLHVLGDALGSIGVIVAALAMLIVGWSWVDPLVTIFIGGLILLASLRLVRSTLDILLEQVSKDVSLLDVRERLMELRGVTAVHDLHVWILTSGFTAMSAHLVVDAPPEGHHEQRVLQSARVLLRERFGIAHSTLQLELPGVSEQEVHCEGDPRCLV